MIIAGIDWSMTSPGITVGDTSDPSFSALNLFGFSKSKKQVSGLSNVHLDLCPMTKDNVQRFAALSDWAMKILTKHDVKLVVMEGYAYGATGKVFEIGENTGVLKHCLMKAQIPFEVAAPSEIKKFATGKGNANKTVMCESFMSKTGIDLCSAINDVWKPEKIPAPVPDMVDSYWIWQMAEASVNHRL